MQQLWTVIRHNGPIHLSAVVERRAEASLASSDLLFTDGRPAGWLVIEIHDYDRIGDDDPMGRVGRGTLNPQTTSQSRAAATDRVAEHTADTSGRCSEEQDDDSKTAPRQPSNWPKPNVKLPPKWREFFHGRWSSTSDR